MICFGRCVTCGSCSVGDFSVWQRCCKVVRGYFDKKTFSVPTCTNAVVLSVYLLTYLLTKPAATFPKTSKCSFTQCVFKQLRWCKLWTMCSCQQWLSSPQLYIYTTAVWAPTTLHWVLTYACVNNACFIPNQVHFGQFTPSPFARAKYVHRKIICKFSCR